MIFPWSAVAVMLAAMILPELLSGNTPAPQLFTWQSLLLYLFAYGFPVLVIRETAARLRTGVFGIFIMGLGYGLINEGLFAKTIFRKLEVPLDVFDNYSYAFGVNWGFAAFICLWHAVASVMLPIVLSNHLFGRRAFVGHWTYAGTAILVLLTATWFFLVTTVGKFGDARVVIAAVLWAVILFCFAVGLTFKRREDDFSERPLLSVLTGLTGGLAFIFCAFPADQGWPVGLSFGALILASAFYIWAFRAFHLSATWFAFGWYIQTAALSLTTSDARSPLTLLADLIVLGMVFQTSRTPSLGAIKYQSRDIE
ncbi:MAG: hypothetical protein ABI459_00045 [Deltaproteobacteria bacterium]